LKIKVALKKNVFSNLIKNHLITGMSEQNIVLFIGADDVEKSRPYQCEFIILTFGINLCGKNLFMLKLTLV